uniref:RNA-directed DNA polymerase n=1 Tax=Amphimedon queenslandica TaxID=400682 RepID=A0A1X7U211_AMPQE
MPRGRKPKTRATDETVDDEGSQGSISVRDLLDVMEKERKRQSEEQKQRAKEHQELMKVLVDIMKQKRCGRDEGDSSSDESEDEAGEGRVVGGREPVLTKFSEKDTDIEHFLTGFERVATAYRWPDECWVLKLVPLLTGKALAAYANMDSEAAKNYQSVKKAILRRFDINEETYRQRFRSTKKKEGQSYVEVGIQLMDLFRKWTASAKDSVAELTELVVLEQLLNTMPTELQVWIREKKLKTVEEAATQADDYLLARQGMRKEDKRCHGCREKGHMYRDCPKKEQPKQGDRPAGEGQKRQDQRKCYRCGGVGHIAAKCTSEKRNTGYYLNARNQMKGKTWKKPAEEIIFWGMIQEKPVEMLMDTGCSHTLVKREFIPEHCILEGETVALQCAHGDVTKYPIAEVDMVIEGVKKRVRVGVSETLPRSVLAGTDVLSLFGDQTVEDCMVMTRSKQRKEIQEEIELQKKQEESGAIPKPIEEEPETSGLESIDDEMFAKPGRDRKTRSQKRKEKQIWQSDSCIKKRQDMPSGQEELKKLQSEDETLEKIRKLAEGTEEDQQGARFEKQKGLLYRVIRRREGIERKQLVLPRECRKEVLRIAHTIPMGGHLGQRKTTARISERFFWPGMIQEIKNYCRTCPECQRTAGRRYTPRAQLVNLPIIETPFKRIAMDIVGPLEKSNKGNKYILVVCDYATRYPDAFPLKSIDAESVAEKLIELMSRVGVPEEILTDQGSNFTSRLLTEIYKMLTLKGITTTPYHPQTDGLVERFNGTLKNMLRRCTSQNPRDWDTLLPYILFAYREVPQESTGFSPFELLYGRSVRGPLDILKESWESRENCPENVVTYVTEMRRRLEEMTGIVGENMKKSQVKQKRWYDRKARHREFKTGDKVLVLLPSTTHKLTAEWKGPYVVKRKVGDVDYELEMNGKQKKYKIFHVNMLRQWYDRTDTSFLMGEVNKEESEIVPVIEAPDFETTELIVGETLDERQREDLTQLLAQYKDVITSDLGRTTLAEHCIEVEGASPYRQSPYRIPLGKQEEVRKEIQRMEDMGVIRPTTSDWASPMVIVPKKDGSIRLCVDYRKLNNVSKFDAYPIPRVDEMIDRMGSGKFITTLDLNKGYWQIPVEKSSQEKTAFITPMGLYEFVTMPFGLRGAPATFQRLMDRVLRGTEQFAGAYIDDVAIHSETWEGHLQHLREVLEKLQGAGLTANPSKCKFGMTEVLYLGHKIGGGRVKPEESKVKAVKQYPVPKTKTEVRSFLGLVGYYRKFIPQFSSIAAPLSDLTKKNVKTFVWTEECQASFQLLKKMLCGSPVLRTPDIRKEMILQTDASNRGLGAVLSQIGEDGEEHPIVYISRKLLPREEKYAVVEKECLAVVWAIQTLKVYLYGQHFRIQTDHHALYWLDRMKSKNERLSRWSLYLQEWNFRVEYRKGTENGNADGLSRGPVVEQPSCSLEVEGGVMN